MISSIRARLMLWHLLVTALILASFSGVLYWSVSQSFYRELDASLPPKAEAIVSELDFNNGRLVLEEGKVSKFVTPDLMFQISDLTGNVLARSANLGKNSLPLSSSTRSLVQQWGSVLETASIDSGLPLRLITILSKGDPGDPSILVQVGKPLDSVESALGRLRFWLLVVAPTLLVLSSFGAFFLANRQLRPLKIMAQSAERISDRDLRHRLPVVNPQDEIGHLAETFNRLFQRLERSFENQRRFVADASHELRTPLTVLRGKLEVALRKARSPEEYRQVLETALVQSERLSQLVEDLLLLARADSGTWHEHLQPVSLDELCVELHQEVQSLARGKRLSFEISNRDHLLVRGRDELLRRMVLNLLDNAIKYTPEGGKVRLALCREDQRAKLTISDTGVGISPEELPHIFERFYQVDKARSQGGSGTGLGLSIVQEIVHIHRGEIRVESIPGQGSIFRIYLSLDEATTPLA